MAAVSHAAPSGRVLGVDLGERRIGLALSDPGRVVASPHAVLARGPTPADDHRAIVDAALEQGATLVVVGLPRSLSGRVGPAAAAVLAEVDAIRVVAGPALPVVVHDERFTTVVAERTLRAARLGRAARRRVVDKVAAAVMLQAYLDAGVTA